MKARRLTRGDAAALRGIRHESLRLHPDAYGSTHDDWSETPLPDFADRIAQSFTAGLFDGSDLVGMAVYDRERGGNTRHRGWVTAVYIRKDFRGRGGLARLMQLIEDQARSDGVLQLELHVAEDNAAAFHAYRSAGYQACGKSPRAILSDGRFIDEVLMIKRLDG